ncbi:HSPG2_1 protein, partial [Elysia marginata]
RGAETLQPAVILLRGRMSVETTFRIALLSILLTSILAQHCVPGENCKLPNCRCWDDPKAPGGFGTPDIPQIIIVSFQYGVNSANINNYTQLFA